jgi:DNA-binding response OmpR family regulator
MTKVILHVEDDENDVLLFEHALSKARVDNPVYVASNGRQAIHYLKGEGKFADRDEFPLPWLILLDLKLPLVPGLEVLKWIRHEARLSIPVLILTSSENEVDMEAAYELCANAYLVKPNEVGKLAEVAKAIKDFWLTLNCLPAEPKPFPSFAADERKPAKVHSASRK